MNLGVSGLDLTMQDIYGPAQQAPPQRNSATRNNVVNNTASSNPMSQQTLSAAEQAANQVAANTQMQLQIQNVIQNAQAANSNSIAANNYSMFGGLPSTQSSQSTGFFADHPGVSSFIDQAEDTAAMFGNFLMSSPPGAAVDAIGTGVLAAAGMTKSIISSKWMMGLFGGLDNGVQNVLAEADNVIGNSAHSMIQATQLSVYLAFKDAGILDEDGRLTEYALKSSSSALSAGPLLKNSAVVAELTSDGSDITAWTKLTTPSVELATGQSLQIHFYQNIYTAEVNYDIDFKVKGTVYPTYPWRNTDLEELMQPKTYSSW